MTNRGRAPLTAAGARHYVGGMAMDSPTLQRRLRGVFDARVFNHGDYNLVYAQPSGGSPAR